MTARVPFSVLRMPSGMKELIDFALQPIRVPLVMNEEDVIAYRLSYASGLHLTVIVMFVARRRWLFFRRPAICLSVVDAGTSMNIRSRYTVEYVGAPIGPHDIQFSTDFMARFAAVTRAVADVLGAGERTDVS